MSDFHADEQSDRIKRLSEAAYRAYAPYSNTRIAALLRDEANDYHLGVNVENAAYPQGLCAEASALAHLVSSGRRKVMEVWVYRADTVIATPCGGCRQKLIEFASPNCLVHCLCESEDSKVFRLSELLPHSFTLEKHT